MSALASVALSVLRGNQRPGLLHLPDGTDAHIADAMYLLDEWGFGYDDAQRFVIASSLREQPDGRWAAKEVGFEEPRQNGKGETAEGRECLGLFYLEERKLIHSAHEFATASEALDRMDDRIARNPKLKRRVRTVKRSHGEEGVYLRDGRSLRYKTRTKGGGRGFSADFLLMDEAMYIAEAFLGALMPVISARPNPQMWYMGSAVDQETMDNGTVFARLRQRALDHKPGRMAYFGWSAAYDDGSVLWDTPADVPEEAACDPAAIARANPALGIRIELEHVLETELPAMDHVTFCVERLGVGNWPALTSQNSDVRIEDWRALTDRQSAALDPVCFAFDVKPDRSAAAIGVAGARPDGRWHLEIVEHRPGTEWVAARLAELTRAHSSLEVPVDKGSPAGALIPALEQMGVAVNVIGASEQAQAYGAFVDGVQQGRVRHRGSPELDSAVKGAAKRALGEAWAWSRKSSDVDISPLVSVTLAFWGITKIGTGAGGFEW